MKKNLLVLPLFFVIFFSGCSHQNKPPKAVLSTPKTDVLLAPTPEHVIKNVTPVQPIKNKNKELVTQAKQQNLPVPVGYKLKGYSDSENSLRHSELFVYDGSLSIEQVIKFYKKELELNGWIYSDLSTKKEGLIVSDKSPRKCIISIRPIKANNASIHLFVQNKKSNTDANNFVNLSNINKGHQPW